MRIIGVGDNTADMYLHLGLVFPGGNAVNVAVFARRYGCQASYLGWLGNDVFGDLILGAMNEEGVDTSFCRVVEGANARSEVTIVNGDRVFGQSHHGVTGQLYLAAADLDFIREHDLVHTSIYSHIEPQLTELSRAAAILSFDFSQDWSENYLVECLSLVDIAMLSFPDRSQSRCEDLVHWVHSQGPRIVLLTRGKEGAVAYDGREMVHQGIVETGVVDTLGAGDAFMARFLVEYLSGSSLEVALGKAALSAAETCGYYGAFGHGIPIAPA
jgi:fructoselysine 6-kinase